MGEFLILQWDNSTGLISRDWDWWSSAIEDLTTSIKPHGLLTLALQPSWLVVLIRCADAVPMYLRIGQHRVVGSQINAAKASFIKIAHFENARLKRYFPIELDTFITNGLYHDLSHLIEHAIKDYGT